MFAPRVPPIELQIKPGRASAEDISDVLSSLADLVRAQGRLGLDFTSSKRGTIEGHFVRTLGLVVDHALCCRILEVGGYTSFAAAFDHAVALTVVLCEEVQHGELFFKKDGVFKKFEIRGDVAQLCNGIEFAAEAKPGTLKVDCFLGADFNHLCDSGRFASEEFCLRACLSILLEFVDRRSKGESLFCKHGEDYKPVQIAAARNGAKIAMLVGTPIEIVYRLK